MNGGAENANIFRGHSTIFQGKQFKVKAKFHFDDENFQKFFLENKLENFSKNTSSHKNSTSGVYP